MNRSPLTVKVNAGKSTAASIKMLSATEVTAWSDATPGQPGLKQVIEDPSADATTGYGGKSLGREHFGIPRRSIPVNKNSPEGLPMIQSPF
jgi:hypothetical protein